MKKITERIAKAKIKNRYIPALFIGMYCIVTFISLI